MDLNASKNLTNQRSRAEKYIKNGWSPVPVKFMGEEPLHPNWQNLRIGEKDIARWFPDEPTNIGVRLAASGGLVDVHFVDKDALRFAHDFLPRTWMTFGPASARSSHWLYQLTDGVGAWFDLFKWSAAGIGTIAELRGDGQMTVFPDQIDELGEPITFEEDYGPMDFHAEDIEKHCYCDNASYLAECIVKIAVATVLYKRARNSEDRSSLVQSMTKLLLGSGWGLRDIKEVIGVVERELGAGGQKRGLPSCL